ncbi:transmembrane anchor protein [Duganella sp. Dugasp56]|uniref:transmembrane anchor protein n=1 Tax=Duganella sp. Dugasp56 TaxID=3243046 RepID=UPI0039AF2BB3
MITTYETASLPTLQQLGKATGVALAVAALILTVAVLPAEYGIDPLGAGGALGLTKLYGGARKTAEVLPVPASGATQAAATQAGPVSGSAMPLRSDEMRVTLQPGQGAEVKALMRKGEHFVFSWSSDGGPVKSDMHGEPEHAKPGEFTTYWKVAQQSAAQGAFTAGFDGIHGWFWRNKGAQPVTITVKVTGFHEKLFRPS